MRDKVYLTDVGFFFLFYHESPCYGTSASILLDVEANPERAVIYFGHVSRLLCTSFTSSRDADEVLCLSQRQYWNEFNVIPGRG